MTVSVECCFWYADWLRGNRSSAFRYLLSYSAAARSVTFEMKVRLDNGRNYMDCWGGDHKWQTMVVYGWLVVGQSVAAGLAYARYVCDLNSATAAVVCGLWCYTSVICLCLCFHLTADSRLRKMTLFRHLEYLGGISHYSCEI